MSTDNPQQATVERQVSSQLTLPSLLMWEAGNVAFFAVPAFSGSQ